MSLPWRIKNNIAFRALELFVLSGAASFAEAKRIALAEIAGETVRAAQPKQAHPVSKLPPQQTPAPPAATARPARRRAAPAPAPQEQSFGLPDTGTGRYGAQNLAEEFSDRRWCDPTTRQHRLDQQRAWK